LELDKGNLVIHLGLAWLTEQAGRKDDAVKQYRTIATEAWEKEKRLTMLGGCAIARRCQRLRDGHPSSEASQRQAPVPLHRPDGGDKPEKHVRTHKDMGKQNDADGGQQLSGDSVRKPVKLGKHGEGDRHVDEMDDARSGQLMVMRMGFREI
jgi:hypothetical protein